MKKLAKRAVAAVLGYQVRRLYRKNSFKVIAVAGSIGKTSTKLAIADVLKSKFRVRHQEGNYNDLVTVPLVFFGETTPSLFNPFAWLGVFWRNQIQTYKKYSYDYVVLELGSDAPGQISQFKKYLQIEIGVLSAITPEHMEFFNSLDAVAKEEFSIAEMSSLLLINRDLCPEKYLKEKSNLLTYAIKKPANYVLDGGGNKLSIKSRGKKLLKVSGQRKSEAERYSILAAAAVALKLGLEPADIERGIENVKPVPGRMQILRGIKGSTIIDDSYNASPDAVRLAINALVKTKAIQRIAILGNMNELGEHSQEAHTEIGKLCKPSQIDLLVTIGPDANGFLAPAAKNNGCTVEIFDDPYRAGQYVESVLKNGASVLVKGSQNGVFSEEAIKFILADKKDASKLVRQSKSWMKIKSEQFPGLGWVTEKK